MAAPFETHEVLNQSPPFEDVDLFALDRPLQDALAVNGAGGEAAALSAFGRRYGSAEMLEEARRANENPPRLASFDRNGFRRDCRSRAARPTAPRRWKIRKSRRCWNVRFRRSPHGAQRNAGAASQFRPGFRFAPSGLQS
jgi:hypothetical protein